MFFILSKVLYFLVMPITILCFCFLAAWIVKNPIYKKRLFLGGIAFLLFFSNDFIINQVMLWWEVPPTPIQEVASDYDVAIVLTGITTTEKPPLDRVYFNKGADRIMHAIQLYKLKKVKKILITGGSGSLLGSDIKEADELKKILLLCEVPEDDILIENQSRNTRENAAFSSVVLKEKFPKGKYLLITSAFHLPRAEACFRKEGIEAHTFSTDFYTYPTRFTPDKLILPSEAAMVKWNILIREILGITAYKILGYI